MDCGIRPSNLLLARNKSSSLDNDEEKDVLVNSIGPVNWFPSKETVCKEGLENKDLGKGPKNELLLTSKCSKLWNPLMSDGSVDVKLLERRLI